MLNEYEITYLDSECGDKVMTSIQIAEDESDAIKMAYDDDYYFGKLLECVLINEDVRSKN